MAIKRLAAVLLGIGVLVIPSVFWIGKERSLPSVGNRYSALCDEISKIPSLGLSAGFVDVTDKVGVHFVHRPGPLGTYFMPEANGAGGALFDFDNDKDLDILLIQCGRSPNGVGEMPGGIHAVSRLFRQESNGTFSDVTSSSGLTFHGYGVGCATGDFDNDGDLDVYVTDYGSDHFFQNNGDSTFSDITDEIGLKENGWTTGVTFFDYDRDGWLDLFIASYVEDPFYGHSVACRYRPELVTYCGPKKFFPTTSRLFHNEGAAGEGANARRHFVEVSEQGGMRANRGAAFTAVSADFNRDGWPDIYVAHDMHPNQLWINGTDGTFVDQATVLGVSASGKGIVQGSMGVAVGDLDANGAWDILVSNFSMESCALYVADNNGFFSDRTQSAQLSNVTLPHTGWGVAMIDLNHDGYLDVAMANGLVTPCEGLQLTEGRQQLEQIRDKVDDHTAFWTPYADRNLLLINNGRGQFRDESAIGGDFTSRLASARALMHGDLDNDGDIDLVVTYCGGPAKIYRNEMPKAGHWLMVRAWDPRLKRDAYGAEVEVTSSSRHWHGLVNAASSYLASNDTRVHFGLGNLDRYDSLVVRWPDGLREEFPGGPADRLVECSRGQGRGESE